MSGIMDKVEGAVENNANQDAQPGNSVEKEADSYANNEVNDLAGDVGVPQQDDKMLDTVVDDKVNNDIPFGNN